MRDGAELVATFCLGEKLDQQNERLTALVWEMAELPTLSDTNISPQWEGLEHGKTGS